MTDFEGCYLTAAGFALSTKKGIDLVFTRAETGSGVYSSPDEVRNMTQLKHKEYDYQLEDVQIKEETADVIFYVTNKGVTSEYKLTEIGIYANDESGEEILYCVVFAYEENAETIDQEVAGKITYCQKFCVQAKVSSDANVSVQVEGTDHEWVANYFKKYAGEVKIEKGTLQEQIDNLKKSVGDGKKLVADAITEKGVTTAADAAFSELAENIRSIDVELHGATISVTTEEASLIGKSATLTKDDTVVDTKTFDDNGACSFTDIQDPSDYTVSASDGMDSTSETVTITSDNIVNKTVLSCVLSLIPDGSTVTPIDDVSIWLKCAGSKAGYTTTAEVLSDADTMFALTSDENAMKYLERSTNFADDLCNDETFMTYLGQSPYVDNTVLNSDLWKQKIKASQYWELVYASKIVTVYGAASETITIEGYYGSFTTGTDGSCSHVVPIDTITLTGSISGQSFTRTVTSSTTEVYVMPEGALYWYGNECTWITGGWIYFYTNTYAEDKLTKETNRMKLAPSSGKRTDIKTSNSIVNSNSFTKAHVTYTVYNTYSASDFLFRFSCGDGTAENRTVVNKASLSIDISDASDVTSYFTAYNLNCYIHAMWLD